MFLTSYGKLISIPYRQMVQYAAVVLKGIPPGGRQLTRGSLQARSISAAICPTQAR